MSYDFGSYDPCPCGSGKKYKFCCAAKSRGKSHGKFPIGTVAHYGPDDKTTTKIAAGVILHEGAEPIMERFVSTDILNDKGIAEKIKQFFAKHGVKNIVATSANMGCPHEEGIDFPHGQECPFCPFWAGKQGIILRDSDEFEEDKEEYEDEVEDLDIDEDDDDSEIEDGQDQMDRDYEAYKERFRVILGSDDLPFEKARDIWLAHLNANLNFPVEVTGIEDFSWEEPYVFGGWSQEEYAHLQKTQPSYDDHYQLLGIDDGEFSDWMMFPGDDLAAHVKRISDGKVFVLGLAELKTADKQSPVRQLLRDFSVWLVNARM